MARVEEVVKPEVKSGTKPRAVHLREPQTATTSTTNTPTTDGNVQGGNNILPSVQQPRNGQQQQQWTNAKASAPRPPAGFQLAYAYVPDGTTLPRRMDSQTANVLRAYGTGLAIKDMPKNESGPPPLPPKPKTEASVALFEILASLAKLMASNLLQSEKMLSNCVAAPENGFFNMYSEVGDKFLDLDQTNTKEGTSIIAWPHIYMHNPAQTWKFVRQSREGFLCTFQNKHSEGHFHVDRAMTSEGSPRRIVQTSTPVLWQLLPVSANKFKLAMVSDWAEKFSVLTYIDSEATYNTIQLLPEDSSNEYQIWTFTTRGLHH